MSQDHIGWPQIRVNISAETYTRLFVRANSDMAADLGRRRPQYYASAIVDAAINKYLGSGST